MLVFNAVLTWNHSNNILPNYNVTFFLIPVGASRAPSKAGRRRETFD